MQETNYDLNQVKPIEEFLKKLTREEQEIIKMFIEGVKYGQKKRVG